LRKIPLAITLLKHLTWHYLKGTDIVVIDAPLLIESKLYIICNIVAVVDVREDIQLERLLKRDVCLVVEAQARINSQFPREERKKYAQWIIDNSKSLEETYSNIHSFVNHLSTLRRSWLYDRRVMGALLMCSFAWGVYMMK